MNTMKRLILAFVLFLILSSSVFAGQAAKPSADYLNSVKLTFLSWLSGSTKISYERAFPQWNQSGELCGSLISAGYDKYNNDPMGFTMRYGHKFFIFDNLITYILAYGIGIIDRFIVKFNIKKCCCHHKY